MPQSAAEYCPQAIETTRPFVCWIVLLAGTILFVSLIIAAPLLVAGGHQTVALKIYHTFGFLCHQLPERSFFIAGNKFAVCSRCTGIYSGATLALLFYPLLRSLRLTYTPSRKWLIAAAVPLLLDFFLTIAGVWQNTHATRFVTGFLLGSVAVFYVMPGIVELSLRKWRAQSDTPSLTEARSTPIAVGPSDYSAPERRI